MEREPLKSAIKKAFRSLGYRVERDRPGNRFSATADALRIMKGMGYAPKTVIDGGANMGQWTEEVRAIFPGARFHMIEPQPACAKALAAIAARDRERISFHACAVTEPGVASVRMIGAGEGGGGTGAYVAKQGEGQGEMRVDVPATTLDELIEARVGGDDRALLKLDLERHEIEALRGAERLLKKVEVALVEVQFYEVERNGRAVFAEIFGFFSDRGFDLFDLSCLGGRARDHRLRAGDVIFVQRGSPLLADDSWE